MSMGEIYFLFFVCGSFGVLAWGLAAATIRYQHWRTQATGAASRGGSRTSQRVR